MKYTTKQQTIIRLHVCGLTAKEIAAILDIEPEKAHGEVMRWLIDGMPPMFEMAPKMVIVRGEKKYVIRNGHSKLRAED